MRLICLAVIAVLAGSPAAMANESYYLIFKTGTLDNLRADGEIRYDWDRYDATRDQQGDGLRIALQEDGEVAELHRRVEDQEVVAFRGDATVGNPTAMFFLESVIKDVARITGGSPFYIRNRFKDALVAENEITQLQVDHNGQMVPATRVTMLPFANDLNRARMGRFASLTLQFTMSEAVPGWYLEMEAETPDSVSGAPIYRDTISLVSP